MTLQRYNPNDLDQFALRLLDLAAIMREMANSGREHGIFDLAVHDKKAQADLEVRIRQSRAKRRAISAGRQGKSAQEKGEQLEQ